MYYQDQLNCDNYKEGNLERGNYKGLKLTDHILTITEKFIENLRRQLVNPDEIFRFYTKMWNQALFLLWDN